MILRAPYPLWNGPRAGARPWYRIVNLEDTSKPAEILIYEQIGKDWWSEDGVGAKDFADDLKRIPMDREIVVGINSPGGNVWDGLAIYNQLSMRRAKVVTRIDGIAASIASVIALSGRELQMPKNALFMIHDPSGMVMGTADDMRKMAEALDKHRDSISVIYQDATGKKADVVNAAMAAETWYTAQEAADFGFATTITDEVRMAASFDLTAFRRVPPALKNLTASPTGAQN